MVFALATKTYRAEECKEKYEDLIYTSMKSIISLNELVTELSVQVSRLTTSLSVTKDDGKKTQKELEHTKTKIADVENYGMRALEKKIEKLTTMLSMEAEKGEDTNNEVQRIKNIVVNLEEKGINPLKKTTDQLTSSLSAIKDYGVKTQKQLQDAEIKIAGMQEQIDQLRTSVAKTNAKVDQIDDEVTLVSGEDGAAASKCVKVCAGTTGRTGTNWKYHSSTGMFTEVNIGSCGFIKTPTVTTSIEGTGSHWQADGTSAVYRSTPTKFTMYLHTSINVDGAKHSKWNVEWIAVGYTC